MLWEIDVRINKSVPVNPHPRIYQKVFFPKILSPLNRRLVYQVLLMGRQQSAHPNVATTQKLHHHFNTKLRWMSQIIDDNLSHPCNLWSHTRFVSDPRTIKLWYSSPKCRNQNLLIGRKMSQTRWRWRVGITKKEFDYYNRRCKVAQEKKEWTLKILKDRGE